MRYGVTAFDIMTRNPITASPKDTVFDSVLRMIKNGVGSLPVVKDKKILGIVTEKDILKKVVAKSLDPKKITLDKIMTKKIQTVTPGTDLFEIAKTMSEKDFRRLPVVVKGKLYGLVTVKDLIKAEPHVVEILADKIKLRGLHYEPEEIQELEGICESCGNYSYGLKEIDGDMICLDCADSSERDRR